MRDFELAKTYYNRKPKIESLTAIKVVEDWEKHNDRFLVFGSFCVSSLKYKLSKYEILPKQLNKQFFIDKYTII